MPQRAPEVEQVVRDWLAATMACDAEGIPASLSVYEGALAIGSDPAVLWAGADEFAEAHASGGPFSGEIEVVEAHREETVAWPAVRAVVDTGEAAGLPIRLTLLLVQDGSDWRVVQSHASAP